MLKVYIKNNANQIIHQLHDLSNNSYFPLCHTEEQADMMMENQTTGLSIQAIHLGFKPFTIDFFNKKLQQRCQHSNNHKNLLAQAIGFKKNQKLRVIDGMSGFGRDGYTLAKLGCDVFSIEHSPLIYLLLRDALTRLLKKDNNLTWQLYYASLEDFLITLNKEFKPDVIYLDPMFPERQKSAQVKKEAQLLQLLAETHQCSDALLPLALEYTKNRVVVKRPQHAPYLNQQKPDFVINGKTIRFDVYMTI